MDQLTWKDYPNPTIVWGRNKWSARVSIPTQIRHCFGNGSGTTSNRTKSTGTPDRAIAERMKHDLGNKIYKEFDEAQKAYANRGDATANFHAIKIIYEAATELDYKNGSFPDLIPDTDYDVLVAMKNDLDTLAKLAQDSREGKPEYAETNLADLTDLALLQKAIYEDTEPPESYAHTLTQIKDRMNITGMFSLRQQSVLIQHQSKIAQSFWQDLLTAAALKQGKKPPVFEAELTGIDISVLDNNLTMPTVIADVSPFPSKAITRPRRVKAKSVSTIRSCLDEYHAYLDKAYDKVDTKNKLKRGITRFVDLVGNLPLQEVEPLTIYSFMDRQEEANPTISARVIKDNNWACRNFFKFCIQKGYVKINPFSDIDITRRGLPPENHLAYTTDELHTIFKYDWKPQERLLLQLLVTTGMRLTEVGCLTWERFDDSYDGFQGMRCFSLIDTANEKVRVKNEGSSRIVPLHNDVPLPPKASGRLFSYKINADGLCSHDAGRAINPTLQKLVPHPRKSAHSFRKTLKQILRNAGVSKEINDFYTGHSQGDVSSSSYGGVAVDVRFEEINKAKHPWLKYTGDVG